MKRGLIDASSAILLAKAGLFFKIADFYDLRMVCEVYEEVAQEKQPFARLFAIGIGQGRLRVVASPRGPVSAVKSHARLKKLHCGERKTICRFFLQKENFIIIDDGKGAAYCRDNGIPYLNALLCPKILYLAGRFGQTRCRRHTRRIIAAGRYAPWVLERAESLDADDLALFL